MEEMEQTHRLEEAGLISQKEERLAEVKQVRLAM